ncbi:site-specific integrase [Sphaerisporangium sp. NPDC005288]|uniref:tyrosine-type recombinase/integrase n=1 Tax=Sphaerisporangium sp. NPDC005288 TaxID=3155114 RepID=UPI0033BA3A11
MPPGIDPLTGEKVRAGETFDTYEEAYVWQVEQNARLHSTVPSSQITLRQVYMRRLDRAGLKQTTKADMERALKRMPDALLDMEIRRITPEHITQWVTSDLVKRDYKATTMLTTSAYLSGVFTWARDNNIETIGNPVKACGASRLIRLYAPDDDEDDYDEWYTHQFGRGPVWTPEQVRHFVLNEDAYPYRALAAFVALQATRRGETIGTRWVNFHPEDRRIRVKDNITWTGTTVFENTPKGGKRRWVILDEMVLELLLKHREMQEKEKAEYREWDEAGWVFTRRKHHKSPDWKPGIHMIPTTITSRVGYGSKKYGFPVIGPHGLRRTWATIAEDIGVPRKVRRDVLGHSGDSMTERYTRSSVEEIREGLAAVRKVIFPDWSPGS